MRVSSVQPWQGKASSSIMRDSRLNSSRLDSMISRVIWRRPDLQALPSASPPRLKIGCGVRARDRRENS